MAAAASGIHRACFRLRLKVAPAVTARARPRAAEAADLRGRPPLSEPSVHSFIIKLRLEKAGGESGPTTWHGYITHVPSGRQSYLRDLDGIAAFITPYLEAE